MVTITSNDHEMGTCGQCKKICELPCLLPCKHFFCYECLATQLKKSFVDVLKACPICECSLPEDDLKSFLACYVCLQEAGVILQTGPEFSSSVLTALSTATCYCSPCNLCLCSGIHTPEHFSNSSAQCKCVDITKIDIEEAKFKWSVKTSVSKVMDKIRSEYDEVINTFDKNKRDLLSQLESIEKSFLSDKVAARQKEHISGSAGSSTVYQTLEQLFLTELDMVLSLHKVRFPTTNTIGMVLLEEPDGQNSSLEEEQCDWKEKENKECTDVTQSNSSDLSEPSNPSKSFDPSNPSNLSDPSDPSNPFKLSNLSDPSNPSDQFNSSDSFDPSNLWDSNDPSDPSDPSVPSNPPDPSNSSVLSDPSNLWESFDPSDPSDTISNPQKVNENGRKEKLIERLVTVSHPIQNNLNVSSGNHIQANLLVPGSSTLNVQAPSFVPSRWTCFSSSSNITPKPPRESEITCPPIRLYQLFPPTNTTHPNLTWEPPKLLNTSSSHSSPDLSNSQQSLPTLFSSPPPIPAVSHSSLKCPLPFADDYPGNSFQSKYSWLGLSSFPRDHHFQARIQPLIPQQIYLNKFSSPPPKKFQAYTPILNNIRVNSLYF